MPQLTIDHLKDLHWIQTGNHHEACAFEVDLYAIFPYSSEFEKDGEYKLVFCEYNKDSVYIATSKSIDKLKQLVDKHRLEVLNVMKPLVSPPEPQYIHGRQPYLIC